MKNIYLVHFFRHSSPQPPTGIPPGIRRQDFLADVIPSAAVGALTSGLTPISIFSNLLNAYATLDSKHDITGEKCFFLKFICPHAMKKVHILLLCF